MSVLAELEEALVTADVGVATSQQLLAQLRKQAKTTEEPGGLPSGAA